MLKQSRYDRIIHKLVLGNKKINRFIFDTSENTNCYKSRLGKHIFISGMSRSGSTSLLNTLYQTAEFSSTTYKYMPFILKPKMAKFIDKFIQRNQENFERAHNDGIYINLNSPESLDGIFWNTFDCQKKNELTPQSIDDNLLDKYACFISMYNSIEKKNRYLSKMNQGISRSLSISNYFINSFFLIPFRNPLNQSLSLLNQHIRFSKLNTYEENYFKWLEHYDFGKTHLPFRNPDEEFDFSYPINNVNYWLLQWIISYSYIRRIITTKERFIPLCYELLYNNSPIWYNLGKKISLRIDPSKFFPKERGIDSSCFDTNLINKANLIYQDLIYYMNKQLCLN